MSRINYEGDYAVEVIGDDVCSSVAGDPHNCAIARAVKRQFPEITYIRVGHDSISFTVREDRKRVTVRTSVRAMEAQRKFDVDPTSVNPEDFGVIRMHLDEAKIEDIEFNEHKRQQQNQRRKDISSGIRTVRPMSAEEKQKRRLGRRHA